MRICRLVIILRLSHNEYPKTRLLCTPLNWMLNMVIASLCFVECCTCSTLFSPLLQQLNSYCVYFDWSVSSIILNKEIRFMSSWCNCLRDLLIEKYKNIRQTLPQQFFYFHHTYLPFSWYFLTLQLRPNNLRIIFECVDKLNSTLKTSLLTWKQNQSENFGISSKC